MTKMPYVCLYESYINALAPYSRAEKGALMDAMMEYAFDGKEPDFTGRRERFLWPTLRCQIDRDRAAYEARCAANVKNGRKGGRPRKTEITQSVFEEPRKAKENENGNDKENEKEKDKAKDKAKDNENENAMDKSVIRI